MMRIVALRIGLITLAVVLGLTGLLALAPGTASAAEVRSGDQIEIASGETLNDDLYVAGGRVTIAGTVRGDVTAAAGELRVPGRIDGTLTVVGGSVKVTGTVDGSVRVLGGDVTIEGDVGRDAVVGGGSLSLLSGASIGRDVMAAGGDVELLGTVGGDVSGGMGSLTINGRIAGDVDVTVDELDLLSKTRIGGDLTYTSANEATVVLGASVNGTTKRIERDRFYPGDNAVSWLASAIFRLLAGLVAGLVLVLLIPRGAAAVADGVRLAPLTSLLLGILLIVLLPVLLGVLMVTVVGIPIALIGFVAFFAVLYLSQVFLGLAIGRLILPKSWDARGRGYNLLAMAIGVSILGGLRMIPVPAVGWVVASLSAVVALGAVAVAIRGARRVPA